jgi:molybdenum cofactor biosynthesis enzyme MoaA
MPEAFWQISLTGGEPTLSKQFELALGAIDPERWEKVVLTTNASSNWWVSAIEGIVTNVNISRPSVFDDKNRKIFGIEVLDTHHTRELCDQLNIRGIDVTFNCVIGPAVNDAGDVLDYLRHAKGLGASHVCFRKMQTKASGLAPTELEKSFELYKAIRESECPACRTKEQIIRGMHVIWKAGAWEPSEKVDEIWEVIFQPTGELTVDWEGKNPYTYVAQGIGTVDEKPKPKPKPKTKKRASSSVDQCRPMGRC